MYPLAQGQGTQLDICRHRKTLKSKDFSLIKRYLNLIHIDIHHFKVIYTMYVSSLPYCLTIFILV